jgi:hypothetical protein
LRLILLAVISLIFLPLCVYTTAAVRPSIMPRAMNRSSASLRAATIM